MHTHSELLSVYWANLLWVCVDSSFRNEETEYFPPRTPNVHFDGLSLISYLLKLAKVSARLVSRSELLHDLTTISSIYASIFRLI